MKHFIAKIGHILERFLLEGPLTWKEKHDG